MHNPDGDPINKPGMIHQHTLYDSKVLTKILKLENVFVKHYAPNHMPDSKGDRSLKENNSELHY